MHLKDKNILEEATLIESALEAILDEFKKISPMRNIGQINPNVEGELEQLFKFYGFGLATIKLKLEEQLKMIEKVQKSVNEEFNEKR